MITSEGIDNLWRAQVAARYREHERARAYAMTPDAKRHLVWLWESCRTAATAPETATDLFKWTLENLANAGVNVLQPAPPQEPKPPEAWKDLWGNPLPNPWTTKDLQAQSLLTQRDPALAEWLQKFAESPYAAAVEWQDKQAAALAQKAITYNSDSHSANPFVNGANETERAQFVKNAPAHVVERCKQEARPIEFPSGKNFNLTQQSKISTIPRLNALFTAALDREREWREGARAKARADIEAAKANLADLEAATK
jgi:hypothetical protein